MDKEVFAWFFSEFVTSYFDFAWVFLNEKNIPIGIIFGQLSRDLMIIGDTTWFKEATQRNQIESLVNFINKSRDEEYTVFWWADTPEQKRLSEYICKHGIARRVGTVDFHDRKCSTFQVKRNA